MKKLKEKWGITSNFQLVIIFIVFGITGSVSAAISGPTIEYLFGDLNINVLHMQLIFSPHINHQLLILALKNHLHCFINYQFTKIFHHYYFQ